MEIVVIFLFYFTEFQNLHNVSTFILHSKTIKQKQVIKKHYWECADRKYKREFGSRWWTVHRLFLLRSHIPLTERK